MFFSLIIAMSDSIKLIIYVSKIKKKINDNDCIYYLYVFTVHVRKKVSDWIEIVLIFIINHVMIILFEFKIL